MRTHLLLLCLCFIAALFAGCGSTPSERFRKEQEAKERSADEIQRKWAEELTAKIPTLDDFELLIGHGNSFKVSNYEEAAQFGAEIRKRKLLTDDEWRLVVVGEIVPGKSRLEVLLAQFGRPKLTHRSATENGTIEYYRLSHLRGSVLVSVRDGIIQTFLETPN